MDSNYIEYLKTFFENFLKEYKILKLILFL